MGFRTLAIEKRSSEVWTVLGAVKTEFGKFGDVIEKVQKKIQEAGNVIDDARTRTRAIERKLRQVQELPAAEAEAPRRRRRIRRRRRGRRGETAAPEADEGLTRRAQCPRTETPMENDRRKELIRQYKDNPPPAGVFQIRNLINGKVYVSSAPVWTAS